MLTVLSGPAITTVFILIETVLLFFFKGSKKGASIREVLALERSASIRINTVSHLNLR